jgi:hypothetical protein
MNITHNQTDPELITGYDAGDLGTGAFVVADLSIQTGLPLRVQFRRNLTYPQTIDLAQYAFAFQWAPETRISPEHFESSFFDAGCAGLCVSKCIRIGCWCVNGKCEQLPATRIPR